jgi:7-cyano-7-deazaguanine reductase
MTKTTTPPRFEDEYPDDLQLGRKVEQPASPEEAKIDTVKNVFPKYVARFTTHEFTSLCPITGQPDFATIVIDYIPKDKLVESKSLKLYLASYRNVGGFHEECINRIANRLFEAAEPRYMRVVGFFRARGGISIDVFVELGDADNLFIPFPDQHR